MSDQNKDSRSDNYNPGGMAGKSAYLGSTSPHAEQHSPTKDVQNKEQDKEQEAEKRQMWGVSVWSSLTNAFGIQSIGGKISE